MCGMLATGASAAKIGEYAFREILKNKHVKKIAKLSAKYGDILQYSSHSR